MTVKANTLRIGTRGSKLALKQVEMLSALLKAAHPDLEIEVEVIKTSGDWKPAQGEVRLSEQAGGKGQFVQDIEYCIATGHVDIGVHCVKDVPTFMPEGLVLSHFLEREDARDVFISPLAPTLDELPAGAVVGTASVRRQAVILNRRPDLKVVTFRGNINTRLEKLEAGQVDAIILAAAGLKRLDIDDVISSYMEPETMLPAVGQGVICIESRVNDARVHAIMDAINHAPTALTTTAERALLMAVDGSCGTPVGSYATYTDEGMRLRGFFATPDGREVYHAEFTAPVTSTEDAHALGLRVGRDILGMVPESVLLAVV